MPEFRLSDMEREQDILLIHSELWDRGDHWDWEVDHPPSGWEATGTGTSPGNCYEQINELVEREVHYIDCTVAEPGVMVLRVHDDGGPL